MGDKLQMARDYFAKDSTPSRAKIITEQNNRRILRERGVPQFNMVEVPYGQLKMPSKKQMIDEGKMDLINKPNPEFGKELAREKQKQKQKRSYAESYGE